MAMIATLAQTAPAIMGQPATFVMAVNNTGASAVNVTGIQPFATLPNGTPATSVTVGQPFAPAGTNVAQVGGAQFNVQVGASGTVYFTFGAQFFGPAVVGTPVTPSPTYLVGANCIASDGTVFAPVPLQAVLSRPVFGRSPGSPPNSAPSLYGQLNFSTPSNSALGL